MRCSRLFIILLLLSWSALAAPGDIPLSPTRHSPLRDVRAIAVASSGEEYLVVLEHEGAILWQRVALDGKPIDPVVRPLGTGNLAWLQGRRPIGAVWTGEHYFVAWTHDRGVMGALVGGDGNTSAPFPIIDAIPPDPGLSCAPDCFGDGLQGLARYGSEIAVLARREDTWRFILLGTTGSKILERAWTTDAEDLGLVPLERGWYVSEAARLWSPLTDDELFVSAGGREAAIASSAAGGALVLSDADFGTVIRPDGVGVRLPIQPIDPLSVLTRALVAPAPGGWTILYWSAGEGRIATIRTDGTVVRDEPLDGPFPNRNAVLFYYLVAGAASTDDQLFIQPAPSGGGSIDLGLETTVVRSGRAWQTEELGIGEAIQRDGMIAAGPGTDLAVWFESGFSGWEVRATRIRDRAPLDGEGLVLASGRPVAISAVFDGRDFSVLWNDDEGIAVRRVSIAGQIVDPEPVRVAQSGSGPRIAARGDGTALVVWIENGGIFSSLVSNGTAAPRVLVAQLGPSRQVELGGGPASYLLVLGHPVFGCSFTCPPQSALETRAGLLTPEGRAAGSLVNLTPPIGWEVGAPIWRDGSWHVPVRLETGTFVLRLDSSALPVGQTPVHPFSRVRPDASGALQVWTWFSRGMLSAEGEPLWYEPLPTYAPGEWDLDASADGETLLMQSGTRIVLRPLSHHPRIADLAVVHVGRKRAGINVADTVRIEHRGGDVISGMRVQIGGHDLPPGVSVSSSQPISPWYLLTEGPFVPGDVVEITARWSVGAPRDLVISALPEAREVTARDNFLILARPGVRRRTAGR